MRTYKSRGIILKSYDFGEADKLITICSEDRGKIKAVAKGLRKTKSRFGGRLEPFTFVHLMLVRGRGLDIVTGAEIICSFQEIRSNLDKMACGFGMLDLSDKVVVEEGEEVEIFYLLLKALEALKKSQNNLSLLLAAFDIKLMACAGYLPDLSSCVVCKAAPPFPKFSFGYDQGGLLCPKCSFRSAMAVTISEEAVGVLRTVLQKEMDELVKIKISPNLEGEISNLLRGYIDYYLQTKLKSREYLSKTQ